MIIVVFATYFFTCLADSPWDPRTGLIAEGKDNQEMAETQSEPVAEEKPIFPVEEEDE